MDVSHWPRGGGPYTKAAPCRHKDSPRERERNLRYSTRDPDHRLLFYIKYKNRNGKERHHRKVSLGILTGLARLPKSKRKKRHGTVSKSLGNHFGGDSSFDQIKRINSFSSSCCISSSSFPLHVYRKEEKSRADCFKLSRNSIIVPTLSPSSQLSTIVYRGASKWTEVVYGCISHLGHTSMATEFPPKEKQRITPHSTPPSPE